MKILLMVIQAVNNYPDYHLLYRGLGESWRIKKLFHGGMELKTWINPPDCGRWVETKDNWNGWKTMKEINVDIAVSITPWKMKDGQCSCNVHCARNKHFKKIYLSS